MKRTIAIVGFLFAVLTTSAIAEQKRTCTTEKTARSICCKTILIGVIPIPTCISAKDCTGTKTTCSDGTTETNETCGSCHDI